MRSSVMLAFTTLAIAACNDSSSITNPHPSTPAVATSMMLDRQLGDDHGAVFTQTNAASHNAVVAFERHPDGSLTYAGTFNTGGKGIGGTTDPLASQYSLLLGDGDEKLLFVANAGSNDVSTFHVDGAKLTLAATTSSGGTLPSSLAMAHHTLYVLNEGSNTVRGFEVSDDGHLTPRSRASAPLSAGSSGGAAIRASRDGKFLVVTEKGSGTIDVFAIGEHGALGPAVRSASNGVTPFGFDFVGGHEIAVSEAGSAATSLYAIGKGGTLAVESPSVSTNGQAAPCWLIATTNGRFAYTANAGSGTISGYGIGAHGTLHLLLPSGISGSTGAGSTPLDLDLSRGDHFLYVLESGAGRIGAFAVSEDGSLAALSGIGGIAAQSGFQGLAAY
jgi:6-phosphogluconolactonase